MKYDPHIHHRRSIRLQKYDYSQSGSYFVTICIQDKQYYFGKIVDQKMILSKIGQTANKCWTDIPKHYPNVVLDEFIIMPNHIHGIIEITSNATVGAQNFVPLRDEQKTNKFQHIIPKSLGSIIRGYKIGVKKWCNENGFEFFEWQRGFYEHIIRDKGALYNEMVTKLI